MAEHYVLDVKEVPQQKIKLVEEMLSGEIGNIIEARTESYVGDLVLKSFEVLVSLSSPNTTWGNPLPPFKVRLLNPGTQVILTVKEPHD